MPDQVAPHLAHYQWLQSDRRTFSIFLVHNSSLIPLFSLIDCFPKIFETLLSDLTDRSGWVFSVVAGGPSPIENGKLKTVW